LQKHCPQIATLDLARLTLDIDGAMDDIIALVDAVFRPDLPDQAESSRRP
jgi:hypothetical protein